MSEDIIYAASWLLNPNAPPLAGGALLVRDGVIKETGTLAALRRHSSAEVCEYPGCVLIPGFVNAHTHLELTHFPAWRSRTAVDYHPRRFSDWIIQLVKISRGLTAADYPPSVREGIRLCLEAGTTAIGEIVTNPLHTPLYHHTPLGGRLYQELLGQEETFFAGKLAAAEGAALQGSGREALLSGLSPHSPYTLAAGHLPTIRERAALHRLPLAIHLSESGAEVELLRDGSGELAELFYPFVGWERYRGKGVGCSAAELLDRHGLLTPSTLAIHCVQVTESDVRLLASRGSHVVLCPRSNDILDVGRAPVELFKKYSLPLALGTDSLASNNSLSLWDELRFARQVYGGELSDALLFAMVTRGGAEALGIADRCGTLERGKRADFQVVGHCSGDEGTIVGRVLDQGVTQELYLSGERYVFTTDKAD